MWVYLDLLARMPPAANTIELDPSAVAAEMGLSEGTVRAWLGHLRKAGYVTAQRLNGHIRVTLRREYLQESPFAHAKRVFTVSKLQQLLKDAGNHATLEAALKLNTDAVIRRALAGALAPPGEKIHRSRTALFLYLLKRYGQRNEEP